MLGIALAAAFVNALPAFAAAPDRQSLAMKYRPHLLFDSHEKWRPLEIPGFLAEKVGLAPTHMLCPTTAGGCAAISQADRLTGGPASVLDIAGNAREGVDYRTQQPGACRRPAPTLDCDTGRRSAIYYAFTSDAAGRTVIDYWWFFRFNNFPYADELKCNLNSPTCSDHEGDWEGIQVVVPVRGARPTVRFDAHGRSEAYRKVETLLIGTRPVVYIALGTHAAYPRSCRATERALVRTYCRQSATLLPEGRFDGGAPWGRNADTQCATNCLLPLPAGSWAKWPGRWGRSCRDAGCRRGSGAQSPGLQLRRDQRTVARRTFEPASPSKQVLRWLRRARF